MPFDKAAGGICRMKNASDAVSAFEYEGEFSIGCSVEGNREFFQKKRANIRFEKLQTRNPKEQ